MRMNRGREAPMSSCEESFILKAIKESKRLDGREVYDYRSIQINPGQSPGRVEVQLGHSRVLASVSCEVATPRPSRPAEGTLFFNVELSPMASPAFEAFGRSSSQTTEMGRILERCFKESRAVDTESLCIIAGEKVWDIRVDLHVLDDCGNTIDCAAIAAITALKHFRRPDVTVIGEEATIHPVTERDPVPLSVHHMPLCCTFAFFLDGEYLLVDPTHEEERVMEGRLVVGMNVHREICALQMTGGVAILPEQILRCTNIAAVKCAEVTEAIKTALLPHTTSKPEFGSILKTQQPQETVPLPETAMEGDNDDSNGEQEDSDMEAEPRILKLGEGTAELGQGGKSTWQDSLNEFFGSDDDDDNEDEDGRALKSFGSANEDQQEFYKSFGSGRSNDEDKTPNQVKMKGKKKTLPSSPLAEEEEASSSEEETMAVVTEKELDSYTSHKAGATPAGGSHLEAKGSSKARKQQAQAKEKAKKPMASKQASPAKPARTKTETRASAKRKRRKT